MIDARTRVIALRAGHPAPHVSQADYEQAKRELADEFARERTRAALAASVSPPVVKSQDFPREENGPTAVAVAGDADLADEWELARRLRAGHAEPKPPALRP